METNLSSCCGSAPPSLLCSRRGFTPSNILVGKSIAVRNMYARFARQQKKILTISGIIPASPQESSARSRKLMLHMPEDRHQLWSPSWHHQALSALGLTCPCQRGCKCYTGSFLSESSPYTTSARFITSTVSRRRRSGKPKSSLASTRQESTKSASKQRSSWPSTPTMATWSYTLMRCAPLSPPYPPMLIAWRTNHWS